MLPPETWYTVCFNRIPIPGQPGIATIGTLHDSYFYQAQIDTAEDRVLKLQAAKKQTVIREKIGWLTI